MITRGDYVAFLADPSSHAVCAPQDDPAIEARFITAIPVARCVIRVDLAAAPVAESGPRFIIATYRGAFRHGRLVPRVVLRRDKSKGGR